MDGVLGAFPDVGIDDMIAAVAEQLGIVYTLGAESMLGGLYSSFELPNTEAELWARMHAGELIRGIDSVTQGRVADVLAQAFSDAGLSEAEIRSDLKAMFADMEDSRAELIARTELANAANAGALKGYQSTGGNYVAVSDGVEFDEECRSANGQIWSVEFANNNLLEHPDCGRSFDPISDAEAQAAGADEE